MNSQIFISRCTNSLLLLNICPLNVRLTKACPMFVIYRYSTDTISVEVT